MEIVACVLFFAAGVIGGYLFNAWQHTAKSVRGIPRANKTKRVGPFVNYTPEELVAHRAHLEKQYRENVHWPILRAGNVRDLKEVANEIEQRSIESGEIYLLEKREQHRKDIAAYDALLKEIDK